MTYEYRKTSTAFTVMEGAFCTASMCTPASSLYVGPASFGGLSAGLYSSSTGYYIFSGAVGSTHSYVLIGGMSEAAMKSYAAGMRAVPKA